MSPSSCATVDRQSSSCRNERYSYWSRATPSRATYDLFTAVALEELDQVFAEDVLFWFPGGVVLVVAEPFQEVFDFAIFEHALAENPLDDVDIIVHRKRTNERAI